MADFVWLTLKRNRGWPWPEDSWGLSPMFGDDGWCRSCGVPRHEQTGSLVLQRRGLSSTDGAWVPNWRFDVVCLGATLADELSDRRLRLLDVSWKGAPVGHVRQIVIPTSGDDWFDESQLTEAATARHGKAGRRCPECSTWRWYPVPVEQLPPLRPRPEWDQHDVVASPEWFGDGWQSFRQKLFRRDLAEALRAASPRDLVVVEPRWVDSD